jgi:multiple sugar transport system ATP-binding protein
MDEPLSNLDAQLRVATRAEILKLQRELGTTTVYVTHDQVEAMTMGDRIAVMRDGVLQQAGPPEELYTRPVNVFVAGFIGSPAMNLVPAPIVNGGGEAVVIGFRPEHVHVDEAADRDGLRFDGRVEVVEYLGNEKLVHIVRQDTPMLALVPVEQPVGEGEEVTFSVPANRVHRFDAATTTAIA